MGSNDSLKNTCVRRVRESQTNFGLHGNVDMPICRTLVRIVGIAIFTTKDVDRRDAIPILRKNQGLIVAGGDTAILRGVRQRCDIPNLIHIFRIGAVVTGHSVGINRGRHASCEPSDGSIIDAEGTTNAVTRNATTDVIIHQHNIAIHELFPNDIIPKR